MGKIIYQEGNIFSKLFPLTLDSPDVITHGCNCQCVMGAGIAMQMRDYLKADWLPMERSGDKSYNKLGQIDVGFFDCYDLKMYVGKNAPAQFNLDISKGVYVVNSYTQFHYNPKFHVDPISKTNVNYEAIAMCFSKINYEFAGASLFIPQIGAGLGGGDWNKISKIIEDTTPNIQVTCTILKHKSPIKH